jgi:RimJ/RimL family protein N-acetyltransferase
MVRVVPERRRAGLGSALLAALRTHALAHGFEALWGRVDEGDEESIRFAERHGFRETGREYEAVLELRGAPTAPAPPAGVEIVSLGERPELVPGAYEVERTAIVDIPVAEPLAARPFDAWREDTLAGPGALPRGCFAAVADGEVVGYAGLTARDADAGTAEHLLTAVRREWRGRGIALALKRAQIAWARDAGFDRLVTYNDAPNEPMRALNAKLGYVSRPASIQFSAPVAAAGSDGREDGPRAP